MIPEPVVLGILAFCGIVVAALVAGAITLAVQVAKWHATNQQLWAWNRALQDQVWRGGPPPPIPAPPGLFE